MKRTTLLRTVLQPSIRPASELSGSITSGGLTISGRYLSQESFQKCPGLKLHSS